MDTSIQAPAPPARDPSKMRVEIKPGVHISLVTAAGFIDPNCKTCNGKGQVTLIRAAGKTNVLCGCAVRRARKAHDLATKAEDSLGAVPVASPQDEREIERAKSRIVRLRRDVDALEGELAERQAKVDAGVAGEREKLNALAAELQGCRDDEEAASNNIRVLEDEMSRLHKRLVYLQEQRTAVGQSRERYRAAAAAIEPRIVEADRAILAAMARAIPESLAKEVERARRRLATAEAYNPQAVAALDDGSRFSASNEGEKHEAPPVPRYEPEGDDAEEVVGWSAHCSHDGCAATVTGQGPVGGGPKLCPPHAEEVRT